MSIITILATIAITGLLLWLINQYLPMDPVIKRIFNIVVIIVMILFLLKAFGVWGYLSSVRV